ncbi:mcfF [Linum perenne]
MSVIKTRLQVATKDTVEKNAVSVIKGLLKTDGIPGLYRGFGTVVTGAIPTRIVFLTALETTKVASFKMIEPLKLSEASQAAVANGIAGMTASLFSQTMFVPIDVVCWPVPSWFCIQFKVFCLECFVLCCLFLGRTD